MTFVSVTLLRYFINRARPYEVLDIDPLIKKNKSGQSFPSRHAASVFIIAMAFLYIQTKIGIIMLILAAVIGVTRVLAGVHFVRDVVGGAAIGIIAGILGFFIF